MQPTSAVQVQIRRLATKYFNGKISSQLLPKRKNKVAELMLTEPLSKHNIVFSGETLNDENIKKKKKNLKQYCTMERY